MSIRYTGPVCWVCQDEYAEQHSRIPGVKPRIVKIREAGWHYSTRIVTEKVRRTDPVTHARTVETISHEVPDRKLHLNDTDPADLFYELADESHLSWLEKHGLGTIVGLEGLPKGARHPVEAYDTHPDHHAYVAELTAKGAA